MKMMTMDDENEFGNRIMKWPKNYRPLPPGYRVIQLDSGHYLWVNDDGEEGFISVNRFWVRGCAFAHYNEIRGAE